MARNQSEKNPLRLKLLAYARTCRNYFDTGDSSNIGRTWWALTPAEQNVYEHLPRRKRMLRIFSEHGNAEEKKYRGP